MPLAFLFAFALFAVVVIAIAVIAVASGKFELKKGGAPRIDGGSGDSSINH